MSFSFISWNSRGSLLNHRKQRFIQNMVSKYNLSLFGMLETKKDSIDAFLVRKLWPNLDFDFAWVPLVGASGELLIIYNYVLLHNIEIDSGSRWIFLDLMFNFLSIRHILIYASNLASKRLSLWNDLLLLTISTLVLSLYAGILMKFYLLLNVLIARISRLLSLHDFLNESELVDLPLQGRSFTWQNSFSKSRIDGCFRKLKHLRERFKTWNAEVLGDQNKKQAELATEIAQLDVIVESRSLQYVELERLDVIKSQLWVVEKRIESLWFQKSRLNWSIKGDRNSNFYHTTTSMHYRNNQISAIIGFYSALYFKNHEVSVDYSGFDFKGLSSDQAASLIRPFQESYIFSELNSCNDTKAPGPDGFNYFFNKRAWHFIKRDILEFFLTIFIVRICCPI
ncbi:uncharacterized protein LOC126682049 [Mercurialis annua]|uniref:uncharacterized protein LOC126682049 n=1 Tax=Mercurialis annua TaxID=3986 RepID=UPI00216002D7|nr:uncharacterized protein LOC126682049 [Mercurialis annua]